MNRLTSLSSPANELHLRNLNEQNSPKTCYFGRPQREQPLAKRGGLLGFLRRPRRPRRRSSFGFLIELLVGDAFGRKRKAFSLEQKS